MLRIKDRFVHHFRDIELADKEKTVSKYFSQPSHNGIKDVQISVLEFIKVALLSGFTLHWISQNENPPIDT